MGVYGLGLTTWCYGENGSIWSRSCVMLGIKWEYMVSVLRYVREKMGVYGPLNISASRCVSKRFVSFRVKK